MKKDADAPLSILYVITKSNWGGAQRYVHDLATAAAGAGHTVALAAGGEGELLTRTESEGIRIFPIATLSRDMSLAREWHAFRELSAIIKKTRPDVVHVNSSKAGLTLLAARLHGVRRTIFTIHGWAWNEGRPVWQKAFIWLAYYFTILLSHRVIAVSTAAKRQARFPLLSRKIVVIHNGIVPFPLLARSEARQKLLPESKRELWIGTIGELHPIKNQAVLIEAFEHFVPDERESELVIIGEGEERSRLEQLIRIEGVGDTTHLLGNLSEARQYLSAFDVFVLPSLSEGLPYVLLEAGMAGVAVVASEVGGIPEIIEDGKSGMLVPSRDRGALTEAMAYVAERPEIREGFASMLQRTISAEFSLSHMLEKTFALYR